jgi:hypothetical protein
MGLTFLNDYAPLPSTAPADHPHVIDIAAYAPAPGDKATQLKLPDAVVTMLHCISAATLAAFLDASPASSFPPGADLQGPAQHRQVRHC